MSGVEVGDKDAGDKVEVAVWVAGGVPSAEAPGVTAAVAE
jgi:hypothetical protein